LTLPLPRVRELLEEGRVAGLHRGAQLEVRRRGHEPISMVIGEARAGVAMTADTLLPWFSCTKAVTAVAVAQQWERGRLHLDDPVVHHVPEFGAHGKAGVTVRHLLTHTAGIRNAISQSDNRRLTWDENVAAICAAPLEEGWRPGRRAGYHPVTAFHLLGEIVRRADGRPFADYVSEEILEPLDMGDSWLSLPGERFRAYGDRVGRMHAADGAVVRGLDADDSFERTLPSGSGIGPMADLVKLYEALLGGGQREGERVLARETVEAITARHRVGMRDETFGMVIDWGLGLMVNSRHHLGRATSYGYGDHASMRAYGHGGSQSSLAFADPEAGLAVALCCNGMPGEPANHRRTQPVITALYEELGLAT
jgi:CubicO group peptidase (beta-lactamase class C family)